VSGLMFYDEDLKRLQQQYPLIAKKIEEFRCETVACERFREEMDSLRKAVKQLQESVGSVLVERKKPNQHAWVQGLTDSERVPRSFRTMLL